ncbi:hypothetical protein ACFZDG_27115 [Kitasatospora xanthocidica]|uniref:hypothetical protein n=1 Tax=Kitasatospora xanthocidica TaxID=83382 RepID=UPI0036EFC0F4
MTQTISDVGDPQQLVRYAEAALLTRLAQDHRISQNTIARALDISPASLSRPPRSGTPYGDTRLRELDEAIVALAPEMEGAGGLSSLSVRLHGIAHRTGLVATIPCNWVREILQDCPSSEFDVLIQASALLSLSLAAAKARKGVQAGIYGRYGDEMTALVDRLILIGVAPPTLRNTDALFLLGSLAKYSFERIKDRLAEALAQPLGFRIWRAITELVQLANKENDPALAASVKPWVRKLLANAEDLREASIYPGRSTDLELAIVIPLKWSPPGQQDWAGKFLLARAHNSDATTRERGTAAHGLWQRALAGDSEYREDIKRELRGIIDEFRSDDVASGSTAGLGWAAETLEAVLARSVAVCNVWPNNDAAWIREVDYSVEQLEEVPYHLRPATIVLYKNILLQNAGVVRRQCVDTIVAGGWTGPVVNALDSLLQGDRVNSEPWLRSRALFALGFLQRRDRTVASILGSAAQVAHDSLARPTRTQVSCLHAALFAIGDCFGSGFEGREVEDLARRKVRLVKENVVRHLVEDGQTLQEISYPVARAAVYMLTFTAEDAQPPRKDISRELLEGLRDHPDRITSRFSRWALEFRFGNDGRVCPLLNAADVIT